IGNQEEDADRSSLYKGLLLILAGGRGSELVREDGDSDDTFRRLYRPFREQVRCHALRAEA
ncbi:hypothetical protein BVY12_28555, partial [Pseudomonas amygdali pv. morsprunorum]